MLNEEIDHNRFIDINIDSENESSIQPCKESSNRSDSKKLFNFKRKTVNEKNTETILANLSEIKIHSEDDDDTAEEDDEDDDQNSSQIKNILTKQKTTDLNLSESSLFDFSSKSVMNSSTLSVYQAQKITNEDTNFLDESSFLPWESLDSLNIGDKTLSCIDQDELLEEIDRTLNDSNKQPLMRSSSATIPRQKIRNQLFLSNKSSLNNTLRNESLVDGLLGDIYDRFNITFKENLDSDVFTEMSLSSSRYSGIDLDTESNADHESECRKNYKLSKSTLQSLDPKELTLLINEMSSKINQISSKLIRQLKQKDKLLSKLNRNFDVITALLQANSLKRREDTQMKFTLNPLPGEAGFAQWKDAMQALVRLPGGVPKEFRKSIWLNLSKQYIKDLNIDWNKTRRAAFNDRSNPDDDELGIQIVKDLHRTGCSAFSGHENEQDRALLKRVLLAYARYNKSVGYCQGFNIIAALILEIVEKKEEDALMCMIFLIDHILPEGYFTNSMHTLSIDMAVFRELLKLKLPKLYKHLNELQFNSMTNANLKLTRFKKKPQIQPNTYEPPLTNVFTMQWFLTLFATCLSKNVLLRVWDCIFLMGSEILFRTSIAIWDKLSISVMKANSADSFYSMMSILSVKLFDQNLIEENDLINKIFSYGPFPLSEMREKFTFNINPFLKESKPSKEANDLVKITDQQIDLNLRKTKDKDEDDDEFDDLAKMISCFALLMPNRAVTSSSHQKEIMIQAVAAASALGINKKNKKNENNLNLVTPGAISFISQMYNPKPLSEQLTMDLDDLKKQYKKLKERQKQAHIIIQSASEQYRLKSINEPKSPFSLEPPQIVNHLLIKPDNMNKNTLKTTVHLNTDNHLLNGNLIEKINQSKNVVENILHLDEGPGKERKKSRVYYSDDESSEYDEDDDEGDLTQTEDTVECESLKKMSLLELAEKTKSTSSSTSVSSSSIPSPLIGEKNESKENKHRKLSRESSKSVTTSIIIDHLVKEENRNLTPLNPFPTRHINSNIAKNGHRLGLYK
ncbi:unnamed protein product [Brachionus calyciflorus]|uniref:Rab-GAP TBC domain-containing protein n=1 Tax=Brachionus calyciflorus TaxID=104777 RepID=A0A813TFX0_9BILA|nr:unnamed protein product [Brachionus calyciflorus]